MSNNSDEASLPKHEKIISSINQLDDVICALTELKCKISSEPSPVNATEKNAQHDLHQVLCDTPSNLMDFRSRAIQLINEIDEILY